MRLALSHDEVLDLELRVVAAVAVPSAMASERSSMQPQPGDTSQVPALAAARALPSAAATARRVTEMDDMLEQKRLELQCVEQRFSRPSTDY